MRIAMTGNPNSGKTTMFNAITGRNEHVGNWAGVTVDKKEYQVKRIYIAEQVKLLQLICQGHIQCPHSHQKKV